MKRVLFIADRVMHYQKETFRALERELALCGFELWLLSGEDRSRSTGRVGISESVVANEMKYEFRENFFFTYKVARYIDVVKKIEHIRPAIVVNAAHSGNISHWKISLHKKRLGFSLVSWLCGYEFHPGRLKRLLLSILIPRYDYHLAYHSNAKDYALAHGAKSNQITVIHNTINEREIVPLTKPEARKFVLSQHPEIREKKIILYVGAVLAEKRLETVFQALDLMKREDAVFVLVGDGEHMPTIQRLATGRNDVVLSGRIIEGVGAYFDAAEMYVLPGTGGLGINEAMAHALPVLSGYADGSADDLVLDGKTGYRLWEGDAAELADRMQKLLNNPDQILEMGRAGEARIRGELCFDSFIQRVVGGLQTISKDKNSAGSIASS